MLRTALAMNVARATLPAVAQSDPRLRDPGPVMVVTENWNRGDGRGCGYQSYLERQVDDNWYGPPKDVHALDKGKVRKGVKRKRE